MNKTIVNILLLFLLNDALCQVKMKSGYDTDTVKNANFYNQFQATTQHNNRLKYSLENSYVTVHSFIQALTDSTIEIGYRIYPLVDSITIDDNPLNCFNCDRTSCDVVFVFEVLGNFDSAFRKIPCFEGDMTKVLTMENETIELIPRKVYNFTSRFNRNKLEKGINKLTVKIAFRISTKNRLHVFSRICDPLFFEN